MERLRATTFKGSTQSFTTCLEDHGIKFNRIIQLAEGPMAAGITIEIMISGGWGALAVACLAWAHVKKGRRINVTTKDNQAIWLEGYSADAAAKILQAARQISAVDTDPSDEN